MKKKFTSKESLSFFQKLPRYLFICVVTIFGILPFRFTNAAYYFESNSQDNLFSTTCWTAPTTPAQLSPSDDTEFTAGTSWLSEPILDWEDAFTTCPTGTLYYKLQIFADPELTSLVLESDWVELSEFALSEVDDGTYFWRVKARDQYMNESSYSTAWSYIIDSQTLSAPTNIGFNSPITSTQGSELPVDLVCEASTVGSDPESPVLSQVWSVVSGSNVRYQRQVTLPDLSVQTSIESGTYTNFYSFFGAPAQQGYWKTKVRAFVDANSNNNIDSGELVSDWSNECNITLDSNVPSTLSTILINEILPDPMGDDAVGKPNGEWVELYNTTSNDLNVDGWVLYDENNAHALLISSSNSDNDLNPATGETVVPAGGFLVVYRNSDTDFEMDNTGDTVRLFDGIIGAAGVTLQDSVQYTAIAENKSLTRIPDGSSNWVDPVPTPGRPNKAHIHELEPMIRVYQQDDQNALVGIFDAVNYQNARIEVQYTRIQDELEIEERFEQLVSPTLLEYFVPDLFLGTVSSGIEYPHTGITDVRVRVTLTGVGMPERTLEASFQGEWSVE